MTNEKNDLFYVCSLIEYIARKTKNNRGIITDKLGEKGISKLLQDAQVNHCLSFEQVSDEIIQKYEISNGKFDTISSCKYKIPSYIDIGKLYSIVILNCARDGNIVREIMSIFSSFISEAISDFSTDVYYQNPDYIECSYRAGYLLD